MPIIHKKHHSIHLHWPLLFLLLTLLTSWPTEATERKLIVLATGPETTELLRKIGESLARTAKLPPKELQFHVVLNPTLNAFALPNRHIVLNSGLLLAAKNRDELAGVMAHEIGHLKASHHLQLNSLSQKLSVQSLITTAAGILAGVVTGDGQIAQAIITGGGASSQSAILNAIRRKESQADSVAVELLTQTGFDPEGLVGFMNRLTQQQQLTTLPPPYLLTHPISQERVMDIRRLIAITHSTTPPRPDKEENQLLATSQAILEAGTSDSPEAMANLMRSRLKYDPDNLALNQGLAEALRSAGRLQQAEQLMTTLINNGRQENPYLLRNRALVRIEMGKYVEAEKDLRTALNQLPDNADIRFHWAFALKEQKKTLEAIRILRRLTAQYPNEPRFFYLLGLAEGEAKHEGEGHIALGRYYALIQERNNTIWHFQEAVRLLPTNSPEQKIAKNELIQARKMKPELDPTEKEERFTPPASAKND